MEKVIFTNKTLEYFDQLVFTLFLDEYFSFEETAQNYVDKIVSFITTEIHVFPHKKTPIKLNDLGSFYIFYKANNRTTWHIFFEKKSDQFLITSILNNHCKEVRFLGI